MIRSTELEGRREGWSVSQNTLSSLSCPWPAENLGIRELPKHCLIALFRWIGFSDEQGRQTKEIFSTLAGLEEKGSAGPCRPLRTGRTLAKAQSYLLKMYVWFSSECRKQKLKL